MYDKYSFGVEDGQGDISSCRDEWLRVEVERLKESLEDMYEELMKEGIEFEELEDRFREVFMELGRVCLERFLEILTKRYGYIGRSKECECGGELEFHSYRSKEIVTLLGVVRVIRSYYYCRSCGSSLIPFDECNAVKGVSFSVLVRKIVTKLGSYLTFRESSSILRELGIQISDSQLRRFCEGFGDYVSDEVSSGDVLVGKGEIEKDMYIEADGTEVRTTSGWKEVKLGSIFDKDKLKISYVGSFGDCEVFGDILWRGSKVLGVERSKRVIVIADGAKWIWNMVLTNYPGCIEIVDFYHACEHLWDIGKALYGEGSQECKDWVEGEVVKLKTGEIETVLDDLRSLKGVKADLDELLERQIGYFSGNKDRMRYKDFKDKGLFIGSGVVESGCKHVVGLRLKRSGMRWSIENAESILQLRIASLNGSFNEYWNRYKKAV